MRKTSAFVLFVLLAVSLHGQSVAGLGAISGIVRDASGAAIPNAKVTISNTSRGITRSLATNPTGSFTAPSLLPSEGYEVSVDMPGFRAYHTANIIVAVGRVVFIDAAMEAAGPSAQVEVRAAAPLIEPGNTEISQVVNTEQIQDLPINGRRVDSFVLLAPGVVPDGVFGLLSFRGIAGGNSFLTDGNDTTDQYYNENAGRTRITTQISQDAVQEFQVLTSTYNAEFGRALGGVVNTVTRSGTNSFHGTGYGFFRNQHFNARDPFAATNPLERRIQAGASAGGKIIENKLFFFVNGEVVRRDFPLSASLRTPPFFDAAGNYTPVQPNGAPTCGAPATPDQCNAAVSFLGRQFQTLDRSADSDLGFARLDWRPTDRNTISASMNYLRWISPNGIQTAAATTTGTGVGNNGTSTVRSPFGRLTWTSLPSVLMVNEFRFGWFKDKQFDYVSQSLSWPGIGLLGVTVQGQANLGTAVDYPRLNPSENRYEFADSLSWTGGRHAVKLGADVMVTEDYTDLLVNRAGTYTYPTLTAFAQDLTGNISGAKHWQNYSQRLGNPVVDTTVKDVGIFGQDEFRATANLTINLGVRYDYSFLPQPIMSGRDRVNPTYPETGRIPSAPRNFAPRAGIAYALNKETLVRGGYGIYYARYQTGMINTLFLQNGMSQTPITLNSNVAADLATGPIFPNKLMLASQGAPAGTVDLEFASDHFRNGYTQQADVAVDRELPSNLLLTVSFLWSRGAHLAGVRDLNVGPAGAPMTYRINDPQGNQVGTYTTPVYLRANRVDPQWNRINVLESDGNSYYRGLLVQLQRRLSSKLQGSVAYTWSHAEDDNQGAGSQNVFFSAGPSTLFNGNYQGERGTSVLDQRHRLTLTTIWSPTLNHGSETARRLLNHWQFSQISVFASAPPVSAVVNVIGTPFPGAAFNTTLNGFGGSTRVPFLPVNSLSLDPVYRTDARLTRMVRINDRFQLHLMFEAFNVFNHTYATSVLTRAYDASGGVLTPASRFGAPSATGGFPDGTNARRAQAAVRVVW